MNKELSIKLYNLNITCMLLVVVLHAQNVSNRINGFVPPAWDCYLQGFLSGGIATASIPLFLTISGFLFFDQEEMTIAIFKSKIAKRFRTLLVPYLLVSLLGILIFISLQSLPFTSQYFNNEPLTKKSFFQLLNTWLFNPVNYQLWFLRNLFCAVLLSPLVYYYLRILKLSGLLLLGLVWLYFAELVPYHIMPTVFFFTCGGYIKMYGVNKISNTTDKGVLPLFILWAALIIIRFIITDEVTNMLILNVYTIIGVPVMWKLMDIAAIKRVMDSGLMTFLKGFSFFIFLFHEPLLTILMKIIFAIMGKNAIVSVVAYFSTILISVIVCVIAGALVKKYLNSVYGVLTGSR